MQPVYMRWTLVRYLCKVGVAPGLDVVSFKGAEKRVDDLIKVFYYFCERIKQYLNLFTEIILLPTLRATFLFLKSVLLEILPNPKILVTSL